MKTIVPGITVLVLACGGSGTKAPVATDKPVAPPKPAATTSKHCVTAQQAAQTTAVSLHAQTKGTIVCATMKDDSHACWVIDCAGSVQASKKPTQPQPHVVRQDAEGKTTMSVVSTSGAHKAVLEDSTTITISDTATGKPTGTIEWTTTQPGGVTATVTAMYFLGDTLLLVDSDAGPHEDVIAYGIDGKLRGTVWPELWGGTATLLDAHTMGFTAADLRHIGIYDARTHKLTKLTNKLATTPRCTKKAVMELQPDTDFDTNCPRASSPEAKLCCKDLAKHYRWRGARLLRLASGKLGLVPPGSEFTNIGVFDPGAKRVTGAINLRCTTAMH